MFVPDGHCVFAGEICKSDGVLPAQHPIVWGKDPFYLSLTHDIHKWKRRRHKYTSSSCVWSMERNIFRSIIALNHAWKVEKGPSSSKQPVINFAVRLVSSQVAISEREQKRKFINTSFLREREREEEGVGLFEEVGFAFDVEISIGFGLVFGLVDFSC